MYSTGSLVAVTLHRRGCVPAVGSVATRPAAQCMYDALAIAPPCTHLYCNRLQYKVADSDSCNSYSLTGGATAASGRAIRDYTKVRCCCTLSVGGGLCAVVGWLVWWWLVGWLVDVWLIRHLTGS